MSIESAMVFIGSSVIISTTGAYKFLRKKVKKMKDKYLPKKKKHNLFLDDIEYQEATLLMELDVDKLCEENPMLITDT